MRAQRGFGFIEMLFVVLILSILVGGYGYFGGLADSASQGTARSAMDRASITACQASRQAIEGSIEIWLTSHAGEPMNGDILRLAGLNINCPHTHTGGTYVYMDGTVYCTDHFPPPAMGPAMPVYSTPTLAPISSGPSALDQQYGRAGSDDQPHGRGEPIPGVRLPPMP